MDEKGYNTFIKKLKLFYSLSDKELVELAKIILSTTEKKVKFNELEIKEYNPYEELSVSEGNYTNEELNEIVKVNIETYRKKLKGKALLEKTNAILDAYNIIARAKKK